MTDYAIYHMDDYNALYGNGKLVVASDDMYHLNEYLYKKLNVKEYSSEDFLDPYSETAYSHESDIRSM